METLLIIILVIVAGFIGLVLFLNYKIGRIREQMRQDLNKDQSFLLLNQNIQGVQTAIGQNLAGMHERLDRAAKALVEYSKGLGLIQEISQEMRNFQEFLKSPKLRGNIGEQVLAQILADNLSKEHFSLQYKFRQGQIVDAIVKIKDYLIPIDAKFPMDNFRKLFRAQEEKEKNEFFKLFIRDVKKQIDSISKNYILPEEKTTDFAVMYIPSESIYYEVIRAEEDLIGYASKKNVYIVSPITFSSFLKTVMIGMRGEQIKEEYQRIIQILSAVSKDAEKFGDVLSVLTGHLTNAKNTLDKANNEYSRLVSKIDQVKLLR